VSEVAANADATLARADELARTVADHAPLTLRATKMQLRRLRGEVVEDEALILMCYESADFREGMDAFLAKRPPQWRGV
jgi:enoyl-CoA hydratase/carnithine racemase